MFVKKTRGGPEGSRGGSSVLQTRGGDPLQGLTRDREQSIKVIEIKRGFIAPCAGLIR